MASRHEYDEKTGNVKCRDSYELLALKQTVGNELTRADSARFVRLQKKFTHSEHHTSTLSNRSQSLQFQLAETRSIACVSGSTVTTAVQAGSEPTPWRPSPSFPHKSTCARVARRSTKYVMIALDAIEVSAVIRERSKLRRPRSPLKRQEWASSGRQRRLWAQQQ